MPGTNVHTMEISQKMRQDIMKKEVIIEELQRKYTKLRKENEEIMEVLKLNGLENQVTKPCHKGQQALEKVIKINNKLS